MSTLKMRARNYALGLVILVLILLLTACGSRVSSGTVVDKQFDPARSWTEPVADIVYVPVSKTRTSCSYNSTTKSNSCSTYIYTDMEMRIVGYHDEVRTKPDEWFLVLEDSEGNQGRVQVTQDIFSGYRNGDWYGETT